MDHRVINTAILRAKDRLGFDDFELRNRGLTSSNVVYSCISKFDDVVQILLEIGVDEPNAVLNYKYSYEA